MIPYSLFEQLNHKDQPIDATVSRTAAGISCSCSSTMRCGINEYVEGKRIISKDKIN